jgi:hypothetical protein
MSASAYPLVHAALFEPVTAAAIAARRDAALRCVDHFGSVVRVEKSRLDAARDIEICFFDQGWTEQEVMRLFDAVATSVSGDSKAWTALPDITWVIDLYPEFAAQMCACSGCRSSAVTEGDSLHENALVVAEFCRDVLVGAEEPEAIAEIARQLKRRWKPRQLVRAAIGYNESMGGDGAMRCARVFGKPFDVFCPFSEFQHFGETYSATSYGTPWYPRNFSH